MSDQAYVDLFGQPVLDYTLPGVKEKRKVVANGYPARPGTGPVGETCGTCEHRTSIKGHRRNFWKCLKFRSPVVGTDKWPWSASVGSDIRLKSPACRYWEQALSKTPKP